MNARFSPFVVSLALLAGCDSKPDKGDVLAGNGFTIVGTFTDDGDPTKSKQNAEDVLNSHSDLAAFVGLFAYNPPACINALRAQGKLNQVKIIGFDEEQKTLDGIAAGEVVGTVVQDPYGYGYQAIQALKELHEGDDRPTFAFVTNGKYTFWEPARAGVKQAGIDLDVGVEFRMPNNELSDQKQVLEDLLNAGIDGVAISVIDPANQAGLINRVAESVPVVTHDSDAPGTARKMFIGVDNYEAGRMAGELVKRALPDGGKVALLIGNLSQDNARLRRQGVIDALLGRTRAAGSGGVEEAGEIVVVPARQIDGANLEVFRQDLAKKMSVLKD